LPGACPEAILTPFPAMTCPACGTRNAAHAETCANCGETLAPVLTVGSIVASRYEILSILGTGGMGTVYKAQDRVLDERVALKVLKPEYAKNPDMARRFQSEIKLARKVTHKNVCRIHDQGQDGNLRYLSMELVSGTDLRHVLKVQGGLLADGAFEVAVEIASGLQAIHDVGIIHRDLKTLNIMLDSRGVVRLLDFGIAKEGGSIATSTGFVIGTPEYMSPEQAQGMKLDYRSDIYALGIVVFEIFTGRVPFQGGSAVATLYKHVNEAPPLDEAAAQGMPQGLVAILRKALAKRPVDRFATALEFAEALRAVQGNVVGPVALGTPTSADDRATLVTPAFPAQDGSTPFLEGLDELFGEQEGHLIRLLNAVLKAGKAMSGATAGRVLVFANAEDSEQLIDACVGDGSEDLNGLLLEKGEGIAAAAAETGESFRLEKPSEHPRFSSRCDALPSQKGLLCVPLKHRGLRGALLLGGTSFQAGDQDKIGRLARCAAVAIENGTLLERSVEAFAHTSEILVSFLERVDPLYAGHSREVAALTQIVAERLGLSPLEQRHVYCAALLHDVGKFRLDPTLLRTEGNLSEEQKTVLHEHVVLGVQLLAPITPWEEVLHIIHGHHERWDGTGYPRGLKGEEIPLGARIVAVCDVFDAIQSRGSGRGAAEALADLEANAGTQLDPGVVKMFVSEHRDRAARIGSAPR
jgi:putative nucleotidyltransferase with HDIG domain